MKLGKKLGLITAAMLAVSPVALSATAISHPVVAAKTSNSDMDSLMDFVKKQTNYAVARDANNGQKVNSTIKFVGQTKSKIVFAPTVKGDDSAGTFTYAEGIKLSGFPKVSQNKTYNLYLAFNDEDGENSNTVQLGKVTVPANSTTGIGFFHYTMKWSKANESVNKGFELPVFVDESVPYKNISNSSAKKSTKKTSKKSTKKSKKSKKSSKKSKKTAKKSSKKSKKSKKAAK